MKQQKKSSVKLTGNTWQRATLKDKMPFLMGRQSWNGFGKDRRNEEKNPTCSKTRLNGTTGVARSGKSGGCLVPNL